MDSMIWEPIDISGMFLESLAILAALFGHMSLWVVAFNNLHARRMPFWSVQATSIVCYLSLVTIPFVYLYWYLTGYGPLHKVNVFATGRLVDGYVWVCWAFTLFVVLYRFRWIGDRANSPIRSNYTSRRDMLEQMGARYDGPAWVKSLAHVPGNQIFDLQVHDLELEIANLPQSLDGLSIAHLSDFHYTGDIAKAFFEEVIDVTLAMEADLIAITGDLVDKARCFDWIDDTFGRLHAPAGVHYVLGNHDERVDVHELHRRLAACGLNHIGARWQEITVRDQKIVIAGNELPWFVPAADLENAPPKNANGEPLRIALAHSPDQFYWGQSHQIDLMLAGHTHGGQFRFPLIGAIVSPCLEGTRFAIGTYYRSPTVMHVSRGLSGTTPVRVGCPPELTRIVLRTPLS